MSDLAFVAPALGSVVLIDQGLKAALLAIFRSPSGRRESVARFEPVRARGTFVGRLGVPRSFQALLWTAILVSALAAMGRVDVFDSRLAAVALGLALGGAASNLLDQLTRRVVIDYIDLRIWPAFNLADVAIVGGVVVLLAVLVGGG